MVNSVPLFKGALCAMGAAAKSAAVRYAPRKDCFNRVEAFNILSPCCLKRTVAFNSLSANAVTRRLPHGNKNAMSDEQTLGGGRLFPHDQNRTLSEQRTGVRAEPMIPQPNVVQVFTPIHERSSGG
jgi:hypothetical protein